MPSTRKKGRLSRLAQCIRKTSATASIKRKSMPDASTYNPDVFNPAMSAKFTNLIEKIKSLDAQDMAKYGTKFKHFIFTDIRESTHGAKALASFMIAAGFDLRMGRGVSHMKRGGVLVETKKGAVRFLEKDPVAGGSNGFALLQSLPMWNNPLSVTTKKAILSCFNKRPENVNGELLRIVVLDSKYKEGIDLFDVKYVHLLEPAIASSDLTQAIGRATRFCGQKGLHFIPKQGWPLQVYIYHTELPNRAPFLLGDALVNKQSVDAHELMLKHSGLDLALMNLTKELTILSITTAVDYDLNYKINNFDIESALLEATDTVVAEVTMAGGARRKLVAIHSVHDITPAVLRRCQKRQSRLFPFSKARMMMVARSMGIPAPSKAKRAYYCDQLQNNQEYLESLLKPAPVSLRSLDVLGGTPLTPSRASTTQDEENALMAVRSLFRTPVRPTAKYHQDLDTLADASFAAFQKGILNLYEEYKWAAPIVKSGCDAVQSGSTGAAVSFTRTQDFVRHYLMPESPFKGLLAWHSVGTGKTCMAVATASTHFEQAGYTILWVTRNALMADVYKNIFGAVCSIPIMEHLKTKELPESLTDQKRLLSRAWLPPISYRTFQNALQGKNELGRMLKAKHADPLHKTFLIMDEIHKLQDGDLGAAEAADFSVIQDFIHKSYSGSGSDSVRPLLMTATPITDTPKDLFEILNTLIPSADRRLLPFSEFRERYADEHGVISAEGREYFQDRAKGLISYLNRELDPTTFAQPVFHTVRVPVGEAVLPSLEHFVDKCMSGVAPALNAETEDCDALEFEMAKEMGALGRELTPKERRSLTAEIKRTYTARIRACKAAGRATRKARANAVKSVLKTTRSCYMQEKKKYRGLFAESQRVALESCFGKPPPLDFHEKSAFDAEVERRLGVDDDRSTTGAVKTPI